MHRRSSMAATTATMASRMLVISGGDGYEDFRSTTANEGAGRDDSTNHLLLWQVWHLLTGLFLKSLPARAACDWFQLVIVTCWKQFVNFHLCWPAVFVSAVSQTLYTDTKYIYLLNITLVPSCKLCLLCLLTFEQMYLIVNKIYLLWSRTIRNMKQISWGVAELAHLYSMCWYNVFQLAVCYLHWFPTFMRLIHDFAGMWLTLQYDTQKDVTSCIHWHVLE